MGVAQESRELGFTALNCTAGKALNKASSPDRENTLAIENVHLKIQLATEAYGRLFSFTKFH